MSNSEHSLICTDLALARNGLTLFSGLDCALNAGDLMIVQGANGAGKSSLLMALAGLIMPSGGDIGYEGVPLIKHARYPSHALYLGHERGLYSQLTVFENVAFWARMARNPDTIDAALSYFDLDELRDFPLHLLSEGWKQRVTLTRLLTMPQKLWLLDEPTAHLDQECIALLHSLISTRLEQGGIIVMTTHAQVKGGRFKLLNINDYKSKLNVINDLPEGVTEAEVVDA